MSEMFGMNVKIAIYGESHGKSIGVIIDGLPPGIALDEERIAQEMARRAPGQSLLTTARKETDMADIQSGFFNGYTTGTALCAVIKNSDQHSKDYSILAAKMRPGHADYAGNVRYQGFNDYRGGGHFSARLTAPLVFVGAIAKQVLEQMGIKVYAHILSIADVKERSFNPLGEDEAVLETLWAKKFCVLDEEKGAEMQERIVAAKAQNNSVGGVIEVMVQNVPAGLGAPYFDSVESRLSHAMFSVPATKGIEFGEGFGFSTMTGAEANDCMHYENGHVKCLTNHNGGITGGISNGMPILFRIALKPTPSISRPQMTIDLKEQQDTELTIVGRHDPCVAVRAIPVLEAVTAWTILDLILEAKKWER